MSQVENMAELGWRPREVLGALVGVYINLSTCESFAAAVAGDERSYKRCFLEYSERLTSFFFNFLLRFLGERRNCRGVTHVVYSDTSQHGILDVHRWVVT